MVASLPTDAQRLRPPPPRDSGLARLIRPVLLAAMVGILGQCSAGWAGTPVLTRSYDNGRTGANTSETAFKPDQVAAHGLTRVFSLKLGNDNPRIEAQPLYVPGQTMSDGKVHDVLYVFSMSNNVWAFDTTTGKPIWAQPVNLGPPFVPGPHGGGDIHHINTSFGLISTPVIDLDAGVIYTVNWVVDTMNNRILHVNELGLTDGQPRRPPLPINASVVNKAGETINLSQVQTQRAALLLTPLRGSPLPPAHKRLYVAFTGAESHTHNDDPRRANHGWVVSFDVSAWKQAGAWIATPSTFGGGIWQGSQGPAADENGNVYVMTGNGGYLNAPTAPDFVGDTDFPKSFVKLSPGVDAGVSTLSLADWYVTFRDATRKNWQQSEVHPFSGYAYKDQDLASGGPVLPTDTKLLLGAGKDGVLYVFDRDNLGKAVGDVTKLKTAPTFFTYDPNPTIPAYKNASPTGDLDFKPSLGVKTHHLHGVPVYWKSSKFGPMLFLWGENGTLRAFSLDAGSGKTKLFAHGAELASEALANPANHSLGGMPGGMLTLSASGQDDGIVWATAPPDGDANKAAVPGLVRGYDATQFAADNNADGVPRLRKIWQNSGFTYSKFCPPLVADGKLFVPTYDGQVDVYILDQPTEPAAPPR